MWGGDSSGPHQDTLITAAPEVSLAYPSPVLAADELPALSHLPQSCIPISVTSYPSSRSLRRGYLEWVEERIEEFKETVSRADLLHLADEVIEDLRVNQQGQYQLTELLLCTAVDRKIFRLLDLPGYRSWCTARYGPEPRHQHPDDPIPLPICVEETQDLTSN
jgi:hypothetical protein